MTLIPDTNGFVEDQPDGAGDACAEPAMLDLLLPQDLPVELSLSATEQIRMRALLGGILHALRQPEPETRLCHLTRLLAELPETDGSNAEIQATGIPAKTSEVEDFDRYFHVNRISTKDPAAPLTRGLLRTSASVLELCSKSKDLPPEHVARQIAGFEAYTYLLARCFGLGELS